MKRMLWPTIASVLVIACSRQSDGDYIGQWTRQHIEHHMSMTGEDRADLIRDTLTIERNGDGYLLRSARQYRQGDSKLTFYPQNTTPAILKDSQLQVANSLASYVIDKKSGHLIAPDGQGEYTKVK